MELVALIFAGLALVVALLSWLGRMSWDDVDRASRMATQDEVEKFAKSLGLYYSPFSRTLSGTIKTNKLPVMIPENKLKEYDELFKEIGVSRRTDGIVSFVQYKYSFTLNEPVTKEAKPFTLVEKVDAIMDHLKLEEKTTAKTELVKKKKK